MPAPAAVMARLIAFISGKATSRAPICSGIAMFISPIRNGMPMKNTMMVPWVVKSCAKWSAGRKPGLL